MIYHEFISDYPKEREITWAHACQGITHDDHNWYISQQYKIWKFPIGTHDLNAGVSLVPVPAIPGPDYILNDNVSSADRAKGIKCLSIPRVLYDAGYNHFGDIDYYKGYIFASLEYEEYKKPPKVLLIRASDLKYCSNIDFAQDKHGQHASWCAVNPNDGLLYTSDYENVEHLHAYELEISTDDTIKLSYKKRILLLDTFGKRMTVKNIQGGVFSAKNNWIYLSSHAGMVDGGVYIFDMKSGCRCKTHIQVNYGGSDSYWEELEGLTIWDVDSCLDKSRQGLKKISGQLHLVMLDNDAGSDDAYIKHFRLLDEAENPLKFESQQEMEVEFTPQQKMYIYTGLIQGDFRGYVRRKYKSINPQIIDYIRDEWFTFNISFLIGKKFQKNEIDDVSFQMYLAGISNVGETINAGWSIRSVKAQSDEASGKVKVSAIVEVRDTDGYLNNLAYRVVVITKSI